MNRVIQFVAPFLWVQESLTKCLLVNRAVQAEVKKYAQKTEIRIYHMQHMIQVRNYFTAVKLEHPIIVVFNIGVEMVIQDGTIRSFAWNGGGKQGQMTEVFMTFHPLMTDETRIAECYCYSPGQEILRGRFKGVALTKSVFDEITYFEDKLRDAQYIIIPPACDADALRKYEITYNAKCADINIFQTYKVLLLNAPYLDYVHIYGMENDYKGNFAKETILLVLRTKWPRLAIDFHYL